MNLDQARFNMVEQQIRPWDVMDSRVLDAISATPRHHFVAESQHALGYMDIALPIGEGQRMMEPRLEARMVQALNLQKSETVLEVGTGSGYVTTLLCRLGASVRSIELFDSLTEQAKTRLTAEKIGNSILESGDALSPQWNPGGHYDVVVLTGALGAVPSHILELINEGGRLFAFITQQGVTSATLMTRIEGESWVTESLFETAVEPLVTVVGSDFQF